LKLEQKAEILRSSKFLAGAKEDILLALADESGILEVPGGDTVVTKGDPGSTMYFIASGKARVHDGDMGVFLNGFANESAPTNNLRCTVLL
jgi:hypothetical protein